MTLTFDETTHKYRVDGKLVPSVTTAIKSVWPSSGLVPWAANLTAEVALEDSGRTSNLLIGFPPDNADGTPYEGTAYDWLRRAPDRYRDEAATRGTTFHEHAQALLLGNEVDVPAEQRGLVSSALAFFHDWDITPHEGFVEARVFSRARSWSPAYAGTADLFAQYTHPVTGAPDSAVFDWKSGKRVYPEVALQLSAYQLAEAAWVDGAEVDIPEQVATSPVNFAVHIRDDGYTVWECAGGLRGELAALWAWREYMSKGKRKRGGWLRELGQEAGK